MICKKCLYYVDKNAGSDILYSKQKYLFKKENFFRSVNLNYNYKEDILWEVG